MIKKILLVVAFLMGVGAAQANMSCGIPPIPPVGCQAVCFCDDDGNCSWGFICD